ncbi:AP2 domain family protein [Babesia bovis T2Bo]|uniref:AP2/ERF domain-containing protein n=1 Tax=Babesia bovis TaxID=5865 RepID=A7ATW7_BABBO|nr:AP2 domain family protein [Babesia bovis T2Bo]EDO06378.1 AP2 domain family protein [Babesia bovis T2Bo]|eukprot:XP_001609946.1 hypothetical protein [Babesia bovis T2Bo]
MQLLNMESSKTFLLSRGDVLGVYGETFYNRVTLVNNGITINKTRCWVHQAASDITNFDEVESVDCSCGFNRHGLTTCAQKRYVDSCLRGVWENRSPEERTGIIYFGDTKCVALLLDDGVYLFSTFQGCGQRNVGSFLQEGKPENQSGVRKTEILCLDCNDAVKVTTPKYSDVVLALKALLQNSDNVNEGMTLLKKFPIIKDISTVYDCIDQAQELAKAVASLEGLVKETSAKGTFEMGVDAELIQSCNDLAESLIQSVKAELVAVCSTIIGHINNVCQPPLKVQLRWLKHYMALEYRVEYSPDYSNCFFDEISGRYASNIERERVVLHEIVQCSQMSLASVEGCFRLSLHRMKDYLVVRNSYNVKNDTGFELSLKNDVTSFNTSDVAPFWWNYYSFSNTLGESDPSQDTYSGKRLTRSQIQRSHDDGASTPIARKTRNTLEEHLVATHCVSSDTLGHSQVTTFEVPTNNRKDLGEFPRSDGSNNSLNSKTTPSLSQRSLNALSNGKVVDTSTQLGSVCFCFKCLAAASTFGRHLLSLEFIEQNSLSCAIFGGSPYAGGLEETYDGCHIDGWDEFKTASALRHSIKAALDASVTLGRAFVNEQGGAKIALSNSMKILNTALLSTLRLGDCLYSSKNNMEPRLGEQEPTVKEYYDAGETVEDGKSDGSCSSESTLRDIISNSFVLSGNCYQGFYSTFENDQYIQHDLEEIEDNVSYHSPRTNASQSPRRKTTSPSRSHTLTNPRQATVESNTETNRTTRKAARENNEVYIYDLGERNDAMSESAVEEWYDSDSSVRGSRRQRQKPSAISVTEMYGNHDALIPMGPLPIGVYFDASRKLWRCQWRENGKFRTKGFSLGHYSSLCEARRACILFRCQVGNMPVQPEWLNPNYVQVSQLLSKRSTATSTSSSTPKKSKRKRRSHSASVDVDTSK